MKRHLILAIILMGVARAHAHEAPGDVIRDLTFRMEVEGESAGLFAARAVEQRALGRARDEIADYRAALDQDPQYGPAIFGLARALMNAGDIPEIEGLVARGLALSSGFTEESSYHAIRARCFSEQGAWRPALASWRMALRAPAPEIDWYLGEAECLAALGQMRERAACLGEATAHNPSVVLRRAWCRALIDAGDLDAASREIARELEAARYRSTALLLRARLNEKRGDDDAVKRDARDALAELADRIGVVNPDPFLVAETGLAQAMLGNEAAARACLERARQIGAPEVWLAEIEAR